MTPRYEKCTKRKYLHWKMLEMCWKFVKNSTKIWKNLDKLCWKTQKIWKKSHCWRSFTHLLGKNWVPKWCNFCLFHPPKRGEKAQNSTNLALNSYPKVGETTTTIRLGDILKSRGHFFWNFWQGELPTSSLGQMSRWIFFCPKALKTSTEMGTVDWSEIRNDPQKHISSI